MCFRETSPTLLKCIFWSLNFGTHNNCILTKGTSVNKKCVTKWYELQITIYHHDFWACVDIHFILVLSLVSFGTRISSFQMLVVYVYAYNTSFHWRCKLLAENRNKGLCKVPIQNCNAQHHQNRTWAIWIPVFSFWM